MKFKYLFFAFLLSSTAAFAGSPVSNELDFSQVEELKEVCLTATFKASSGALGGEVSVKSCGETAAEAVDGLIDAAYELSTLGIIDRIFFRDND